jgi:hypothetical protein
MSDIKLRLIMLEVKMRWFISNGFLFKEGWKRFCYARKSWMVHWMDCEAGRGLFLHAHFT